MTIVLSAYTDEKQHPRCGERNSSNKTGSFPVQGVSGVLPSYVGDGYAWPACRWLDRWFLGCGRRRGSIVATGASAATSLRLHHRPLPLSLPPACGLRVPCGAACRRSLSCFRLLPRPRAQPPLPVAARHRSTAAVVHVRDTRQRPTSRHGRIRAGRVPAPFEQIAKGTEA